MFENVHHQSAHQFGKWQFRNANLLKNNLLAAALRRQNHAIVGIMRDGSDSELRGLYGV